MKCQFLFSVKIRKKTNKKNFKISIKSTHVVVTRKTIGENYQIHKSTEKEDISSLFYQEPESDDCIINNNSWIPLNKHALSELKGPGGKLLFHLSIIAFS